MGKKLTLNLSLIHTNFSSTGLYSITLPTKLFSKTGPKADRQGTGERQGRLFKKKIFLKLKIGNVFFYFCLKRGSCVLPFPAVPLTTSLFFYSSVSF